MLCLGLGKGQRQPEVPKATQKAVGPGEGAGPAPRPPSMGWPGRSQWAQKLALPEKVTLALDTLPLWSPTAPPWH